MADEDEGEDPAAVARDVALLTAHARLPLGKLPLGAGGGARVYKVADGSVYHRLLDVVVYPGGNRDESNKRTIALLEALASTRDVFTVAKVPKKPSYRFSREVQALRDVQHPNLIRLIWAPDDLSFYVMPLMTSDVKSRASEYVGSIPRVLRGMIQVADALSALHTHAQPIVHRDIKPANIFVEPNGDWILGDLGMAYREDDGDKTQTREHSKDWAPQWYGEMLAQLPAADTYMLGMTGMALLAGNKPYNPVHLEEDEFILKKRFPDAPGADAMDLLLRKVITPKRHSVDGPRFAKMLREIQPIVENDPVYLLQQKMRTFENELSNEPRVLFVYTSKGLDSGDAIALHRVPIFIPRNCVRLNVWAKWNNIETRPFRIELSLMDDPDESVFSSEPLAYTERSMVGVQPSFQGQMCLLSVRADNNWGTGHITSLIVHAGFLQVSHGFAMPNSS